MQELLSVILNQLEKSKNQLKKPRHWFKDSKKQLRKVFTISSIIEYALKHHLSVGLL